MKVQGVEALTDKEKQTLRLLLNGHDAKSLARHFGLSVHTINERLRDARRKLSVSSSREAARLLRDAEHGSAAPELIGDVRFGAAPAPSDAHDRPGPAAEPPSSRWRWWAIGGSIMLIIATMLALSAPSLTPPLSQPAAVTTPPAETAVSRAARSWLALLDASDWQGSWSATGSAFRSLNTVAMWQAASEQARGPLGRVLSRTLISEQDIPAPPHGYRTVRFRTDFAQRRGAVETVSLTREEGDWRVVGVYIE